MNPQRKAAELARKWPERRSSARSRARLILAIAARTWLTWSTSAMAWSLLNVDPQVTGRQVSRSSRSGWDVSRAQTGRQARPRRTAGVRGEVCRG